MTTQRKIILTGLIAVFVSPWIHYLAYTNITHAIPDIGHDVAHGIVACVLGVTGFVALISYMGQ